MATTVISRAMGALALSAAVVALASGCSSSGPEPDDHRLPGPNEAVASGARIEDRGPVDTVNVPPGTTPAEQRYLTALEQAEERKDFPDDTFDLRRPGADIQLLRGDLTCRMLQSGRTPPQIIADDVEHGYGDISYESAAAQVVAAQVHLCPDTLR